MQHSRSTGEEDHLKTAESHNRSLIAATAFMVIAASLATAILPKPDMLYRENRKAASRPHLFADALLDGSYGDDLTSYINDRTALRQFWIDAKCFIDEIIFMKTEENGILIGKEARLFTKHFAGYEENSLLDRNIDEIAKFASESDIPVYVMIVPSAGTVNPEMLPAFAPQDPEAEKLSAINDTVSAVCNVVDVYPVLREHNDEYIYYRNDHHWTTLGACYAYTELAKCLGKNPVLPGRESAESADDFLGTHYARSRYIRAIADTIEYYPSDISISIKKTVGDAEFEEERVSPLINTDKFTGYDKYAAFLDGNNGYSVVTGKGSGSILVVKDSFANCLVPLMTDDYNRIGVVDYRNYSYGLNNLAQKEDYDEILIIYSFASLETDSRLVNINRPKE